MNTQPKPGIMLLYAALLAILCACASGDAGRFIRYTLKMPVKEFYRQVSDTLNRYGYYIRESSPDSLGAYRYIHDGSLNEREVRLKIRYDTLQSTCLVQIRIITYFRQDTIIEYYDEKQGFPASNRSDFRDVLLGIKNLCAASIPRKIRKSK
jgi:hypothetical protein